MVNNADLDAVASAANALLRRGLTR
jgi:hypothetical protein